MRFIAKVTRQFLAYFIALVLAAGYPLAAMADTQEPTAPVETTEQTPAQPEAPKLNYTYNPNTGHWDSEKWQYNPTTGTYDAPPAPTVISPTTIPTDESSTEQDKSTDTTVTVDNSVNSDATSGDSAVDSNTTAQNATTGDAAAVATLLNVVNSSVTSGDNQKVASFTQDIMGDVKGDIVLYPLLLKAMLEAQSGNSNNSTIDAKDNMQLNNDINVAAKSGDASVTNNTTAGNATTGSAKAMVNVVNILNSMIATQKSFIGTINIYGNLEGDILIAPDFIPQMIANNKESDTSSTKLSTQNSMDIVNNISTVAKSGAAEVFGNTEAGNATTGNADTGVVIFNLTGHEIVAKNSLLVFVNVLGKWVGVIVDAPAGATAAMIGNDVTTDSKYAPDLTVSSESTHGITNTISVDAQSGDAVVSGNTKAGNATTGSAVALANVANISGSQFGVSDWFGVLFINVFQNWYGSFGIDTPYGNTVNEPQADPSGPIQFIPTDTTLETTSVYTRNTSFARVLNTQLSQISNNASTLSSETSQAVTSAKVLGKSTIDDALKPAYDFRLIIVAGSILAVGLSLIGLKRLFS